MDSFHDFVSELRRARHDHMNDIQIIYGYLQLNKKNEALNYIANISKNNMMLSRMYALGDNRFAFAMEKLLKNLRKKQVSVELDIEIDSFSREVFESESNKKIDLVNNIINELENNKCKFVYIYIFKDDMGESILITNEESCANELDWMEDWQVIESEIQDIKLHKYMYNNKIGYRLTFGL
ncbi:Spo0B domain-containing protein [Clostridium sp.]|jgi:sensor histidine kinase regulating citrate/malate metabolism|uniref:Spo0B domain-containing protein n=1 Tax=Clostridium sp. TaxID=1506 RepID=UPI0039F4F842